MDSSSYIDATAALIGLPIAAEHREGVQRYFAIAAAMAAQVMDFPLANEDEPAEVFVPVESPLP